MNIKFINEFIDGETPLDELKIVCASNKKYYDVDLCVKAGMNITFAQIKLYSGNKLIDAKKSFECAKALGEEIAKAFNDRKGMTEKGHVAIKKRFIAIRSGQTDWR